MKKMIGKILACNADIMVAGYGLLLIFAGAKVIDVSFENLKCDWSD